MGMLEEVLALIDARKRHLKRNLTDAYKNPQAWGEMTSDQMRQDFPRMINDPSMYIGGTVGKVGDGRILKQVGNKMEPYIPNQSALAGELYSMGLIDPRAANQIYNLNRGQGCSFSRTLGINSGRGNSSWKRANEPVRNEYGNRKFREYRRSS